MNFGAGNSSLLIDNGAAVVTVAGRAASPHRNIDSQFEVLSTRTGRVIRAFLPSSRSGGYEGLLWASSSGAVLAGYVPYTAPHPHPLGPLEWIIASRHTPIKGVPQGFLPIAF